MSSSNTPVQDSTPVPREFLSFPDGDVVLVSSDDVEFRVDSLILRRASPLFAEMFRAPQTPNIRYKPTILNETGIIFNDILRFIYPPGILPTISSSKHACALYRALNKYQVTSNAFMTRLSHYIGALEPPLRAWALAAQLEDDEVRKIAVRRFLEQSGDPLDDDVEQLIRVEGRRVLRLLRIKRDTVALASTQINRFFPRFSTCSNHHSSMREHLCQPIGPHIPSDDALTAISFHCSGCAEHANSPKNQELRKQLRAYIGEIFEDAIRAESERTPASKISFPLIPTGLLEAERSTPRHRWAT